ncbi:Hypothetical protein EHI5A_270830 [Entamoeba histolytica KU27]|uniref:Uncharacterized protein n=2 Tax=Entamoeba histolytica TaxID=5759 RepID=M2QGK3_ENTHI|nr:Hypothetical protein EHI5A_270830 [Entamoeba histolytica KU27]
MTSVSVFEGNIIKYEQFLSQNDIVGRFTYLQKEAAEFNKDQFLNNTSPNELAITKIFNVPHEYTQVKKTKKEISSNQSEKRSYYFRHNSPKRLPKYAHVSLKSHGIKLINKINNTIEDFKTLRKNLFESNHGNYNVSLNEYLFFKLCDFITILKSLRKSILLKDNLNIVNLMNFCIKKIDINEDFWLRQTFIEFLSWYVIVLLDEQNPLHIENLKYITPFISKWNEAESKLVRRMKLRHKEVHTDGTNDETDDYTENNEEELKMNSFIDDATVKLEDNNEEILEEEEDELEEEEVLEKDITNNLVEELEDNNEEILEEEEDELEKDITNNLVEELEEDKDEDDEMEFEESDDEEFEDPSSIHRITEGVNNHWSFNFQEDHSSLKDLNGFNF